MIEKEISPAADPVHRHPKTRDEIRAAVVELLESARHEFVLVNPALDGGLWNSAALGSALSHLATRHAHNRIRLVIEDTEHMLAACTRLVELARRLSDQIQIRRLGEVHHGLSEMFAVADRDGCLVQNEVSILDATLDLGAPRIAAPLVRRFNEIWDAAEPVPGLHGFRL
jgi:hypothetical protein